MEFTETDKTLGRQSEQILSKVLKTLATDLMTLRQGEYILGSTLSDIRNYVRRNKIQET